MLGADAGHSAWTRRPTARTRPEARRRVGSVLGLQTWLCPAQPVAEDPAPAQGRKLVRDAKYTRTQAGAGGGEGQVCTHTCRNSCTCLSTTVTPQAPLLPGCREQASLEVPTGHQAVRSWHLVMTPAEHRVAAGVTKANKLREGSLHPETQGDTTGFVPAGPGAESSPGASALWPPVWCVVQCRLICGPRCDAPFWWLPEVAAWWRPPVHTGGGSQHRSANRGELSPLLAGTRLVCPTHGAGKLGTGSRGPGRQAE